MTVLDYRFRCPGTGCPWAAALIRWTPAAPRRYTLRCAAGHEIHVDLLPPEVTA